MKKRYSQASKTCFTEAAHGLLNSDLTSVHDIQRTPNKNRKSRKKNKSRSTKPRKITHSTKQAHTQQNSLPDKSPTIIRQAITDKNPNTKVDTKNAS